MTSHAESLAIRSLLRRPNLTAEREQHLLRKRLPGNDETVRQQALSELWESHNKLVVAVARQHHRPDLSMTELVAAGHMGMRAAIEAFDPDRRDTRLATYAVGWIRRYVQDHIRRRALPALPSGPATLEPLFHAASWLFADARRACQREGIEPTTAELCERVGARLGVPGDEVARHLNLTNDGLATTETAPPPVVEAGPQEDVVLRLDHARLRHRVTALTQEILGERERKVFAARCVGNARGVRQRDSLAAELGISRERVYQLEVSAKRKMAAALAHEGLLGSHGAPPEQQPRRQRVPKRAARRMADAPA